MDGEIPVGVARLTQMVFFQISINNFSGVFSPALYNISSLVWLSLANNSFSGNLRGEFGDLLPNLKELLLRQNQFTGVIPITFSNISSLEKFHITFNYLAGTIPLSFRKLSKLWGLGLGSNSLGTNSFSNLEFIDALVNCTQIEFLDVGYNRIRGELPASIANLSTILTSLSLRQNLITGTIPLDIGNLISLQKLSLEENMLTGELPVSFGKLSELVVVDLYSNAISGGVPSNYLFYLLNTCRIWNGKPTINRRRCLQLWSSTFGDVHWEKPTDNSFANCINLQSYTNSVLSSFTSSEGSNDIEEWLRLILQVGIRCSEEYPRERMRMNEAVRELASVRSKYFSSNTTITYLSPLDDL